MPIYAGIGSRQTPEPVLKTMEVIAGVLAQRGWTLRSGMSEGADQAFYVGSLLNQGKHEIYIPWKGFNGSNDECIVAPTLPTYSTALEVAEEFHPAWQNCSEGAKKLHTRNVYQLAGADLLSPVDCVICWTSGGKASGGTGQAIRMANHLEIPVFNLFWPETEEKLSEFVYTFK